MRDAPCLRFGPTKASSSATLSRRAIDTVFQTPKQAFSSPAAR